MSEIDKDGKSPTLTELLFGETEDGIDAGPVTDASRAHLHRLAALLATSGTHEGEEISGNELAAYFDGGLDNDARANLESRLLGDANLRHDIRSAVRHLQNHTEVGASAPESLISKAKSIGLPDQIASQAAAKRDRGWSPFGGWLTPMSAVASYGLVGLVLVAVLSYGALNYYRSDVQELTVASAPATEEAEIAAELSDDQIEMVAPQEPPSSFDEAFTDRDRETAFTPPPPESIGADEREQRAETASIETDIQVGPEIAEAVAVYASAEDDQDKERAKTILIEAITRAVPDAPIGMGSTLDIVTETAITKNSFRPSVRSRSAPSPQALQERAIVGLADDADTVTPSRVDHVTIDPNGAIKWTPAKWIPAKWIPAP